MADDPGATPAPRPRRRRTDIDPTFRPPKVANERRRAKPAAAPGPPDTETGPAAGTPTAATSTTSDPTAAGLPTTETATRGVTGPFSAAASPVVAASPGNGEAWLPMLEDRSPNPAVCPFLRSVTDGDVGPPREAPDPANRCAAMRETVPQSLRQQELVCLASGHVNCPRYLRGAVAVTALPPPAVRAGRVLTPAMVGALAMLVIAFGLSVGFLMSRGGLELTAALTPSPVASQLAVAGASSAPPATALVTPSPVPAPSATDEPTPVPTPTATVPPSPTTPSSPAPTASPSPKSDRYALLSPCPNTPRCWIYVVRRGDNLFSIAHYFGVSLDRVYALNPRVRTTGLRAGLELRLPPPTR